MSRIIALDISDLNERLQELLDLKANLEEAEKARSEAQSELDNCSDDSQREELEKNLEDATTEFERLESDFGEPERDELKKLEDFRDEVGSKGDLITENHGPFVREDCFAEYAEELAEDIGAIDRQTGWPLNCIDWDKAADELRSDYSEVEWDGHTYLYRE